MLRVDSSYLFVGRLRFFWRKPGLGFFKKLFSRGPVLDQYNAYVKEGDGFMGSGDPESAVECFTKAIEMKIFGDKVDYNMHYKRGSAFEAAGELGKAAEDYKLFLLADDRELKASNVAGAISSFNIGVQQGTAQRCLSRYTLEVVLSEYVFETDFSDKKFYSWGDHYKDARKMRDKDPAEAAYRMGVVRLLQGNYKDGIQHLDKAIDTSPEDARPYFFRGVAYALKSRKGGMLGPSRTAREQSKTRALGDFEQAVNLTQDDLLSEQAAEWKEEVTAF